MTEAAYRPAALPPLVKIGAYKQCPQCGALARHCGQCMTSRTDAQYGEKCFKATCDGKFYDEGDCVLHFIYNTYTYYCSPQHRIRFGFLWLRKCQEAGVHVHQTCQRCGWKGIAIVEGSTCP